MKTVTTGPMRRLPVGAEFHDASMATLRVWAPRRKLVELYIADFAEHTREPTQPIAIEELGKRFRKESPVVEEGGYFSFLVRDVRPEQYYGFRLDNGPLLYPDPASRFQPLGPCGPSQFVDAGRFAWTDRSWPGVTSTGQVLYEMHIGTFTAEGTWAAAAERLPALHDLGITVLEVMPVADFPGRFGWGYDGVSMFAPTRLYGKPDDFRRFVDRAHAVGLGVILDVVYNHFGNFGSYIGEFSADYHTDRYRNEWASAINFDGPTSGPVRDFFIANARYWIEEFHLDGFRYDATQCVYDASPTHILTKTTAAARAAAGRRSIYVIGENETQDTKLIHSPQRGGCGLDALWNDDFHHTAMVRLTGKNPAYYSDYGGSTEELIQSVKQSFLYQGQRSQWQSHPRGSSTRGFPASAFVSFIQNHDQIANSATGRRVHQLTSPGRYRAMTALWLLSPQTPLFFQGQEFLSSAPFLFFADYAGNDGRAVARGRADFLKQFPELRSEEAQRELPDPLSEETFRRCQIDFDEHLANAAGYDLHKDLLQLRRDDPVIRRQRADLIEGASLSHDSLVLRYYSDDGDDRLLIVNFGGDFLYSPAPQPLLAPPPNRGWKPQWSSDSPRYGGEHLPPIMTDAGWRIPGESAVLLQAVVGNDASHLEHLRRTHRETLESTDPTASPPNR